MTVPGRMGGRHKARRLAPHRALCQPGLAGATFALLRGCLTWLRSSGGRVGGAGKRVEPEGEDSQIERDGKL